MLTKCACPPGISLLLKLQVKRAAVQHPGFDPNSKQADCFKLRFGMMVPCSISHHIGHDIRDGEICYAEHISDTIEKTTVSCCKSLAVPSASCTCGGYCCLLCVGRKQVQKPESTSYLSVHSSARPDVATGLPDLLQHQWLRQHRPLCFQGKLCYTSTCHPSYTSASPTTPRSVATQWRCCKKLGISPET